MDSCAPVTGSTPQRGANAALSANAQQRRSEPVIFPPIGGIEGMVPPQPVFHQVI